MRTYSVFRFVFILVAAIAGIAQAANTDLASSPLIQSSTVQVRPNLMFILDDSGSMNWDYLPDWAPTNYCKQSNGQYGLNCCRNWAGSSSSCMDGTPPFGSVRGEVMFNLSESNGVAYNPAVTYTLPKNSDKTDKASMGSPWTSVPLDGYGVQSNQTINLASAYPRMQWCRDNTFTDCVENVNYVYPNTDYATLNATTGYPFYFRVTPGEYCKSEKLVDCTKASAPTGQYIYPAPLRWCTSNAQTACQAVRDSSHLVPRYPTVMEASGVYNTTRITVTSGKTAAGQNRTATVTSIKSASPAAVPDMIVGTVTGSNDVDTLTQNIINNINNQVNLVPAVRNYSASPKKCSDSGSNRTCNFLVTSLLPTGSCPSGNVTAGVSNTASPGSVNTTVTGSAMNGNCMVPGYFTRVDLIPPPSGQTGSYPYPGTTAKHPDRKDCAGTTCTYTEEMTNFANWYAYYRTRMMMMKSASSIAFNGLNGNYRLGYMSINNNGGSSYVDILPFETTNRDSWYSKLFAASPSNGTPLRSALSTAGLIYAGKLTGKSFRGTTVKDPIEYSCQQNFTILSTDGYWNTGEDGYCSGRNGAGCREDRTTAIGNVDGATFPPNNDGALVAVTTSTRTVTQRDFTDVTMQYTSTKRTTTKNKAIWTALNGANCPVGQTRKMTANYTQDDVTTFTYTDSQVVKTGTTHIVVTVNGVTQSDTTSGEQTYSPETLGSSTPTSNTVQNPTTLVTSSISFSGSCSSSSSRSEGTVSAAGTTSQNTVTTTPAATGSVVTSTDTTLIVETPVVTLASTGGGVSDTLADVAYYYYTTDLRANGSIGALGTDVGTKNPQNPSEIQNMKSFTLGLGADGFMKFRSDYSTSNAGDFFDIKTSQLADTTHCTWQPAGTTCTWPVPASDSQANIDDLWHAAVNGSGQYASARNPAELSKGITSLLASVSAVTGAAAAATSSNPNISTGDNFVFSSDFTTVRWTGELTKQELNVTTGTVLPPIIWAAQGKLDQRVGATTDTRVLYTFNGDTAQTSFCGSSFDGTRKVKPFCWTGSGSTYPSDTALNATEQGYFAQSAISTMVQFCASGTYTLTGESLIRNCLSAAQQSDAAGKKLVNFLRGQTGNEDQAPNTDTYYRDRANILGDIVSSEAVYVKSPLQNYADAGFAAHKAAMSTPVASGGRKAMVYVGGNDGMLHAFNADSGEELWGYVPTMVMPNLYHLADINYPNFHQYFVDATPTVSEACLSNCGTVSAVWGTVLIGGLGGGGKGYYALNVTDPDTPKGMWEFKQGTGCTSTASTASTLANAVGNSTDCDLGNSYGNPIITKLQNGTWVAIVTSGYNNTSGGNGEGVLYVLNLVTGQIIKKISTLTGTTGTGICAASPCPSGLARINAWADAPSTDNTAKRVYGGDMFGNLWRFDINNIYPPSGYDAFKLAELHGPADVRQPIIMKPELGETNGIALVLVGTGRYLGLSDSADTNQLSPNVQSFYGIKDDLGSTGIGDVRTASPALVGQTLSTAVVGGRTVKRATNNPVNLNTSAGWYIDFLDSGERAYTDPTLALGTLVFTTNTPSNSACAIGGSSALYQLDYRTGAPVVIPASGLGLVAVSLGSTLATRAVVNKLQNGGIVAMVTQSDTSKSVENVNYGGGGSSARRVSWRQLLDDD